MWKTNGLVSMIGCLGIKSRCRYVPLGTVDDITGMDTVHIKIDMVIAGWLPSVNMIMIEIVSSLSMAKKRYLMLNFGNHYQTHRRLMVKLNNNYKLERLDNKNVALFQRVVGKDKPDSWKHIRYYGNWYLAIKNAMKLLSLDTISGNGDVAELLLELKNAMTHIDTIAERLSRDIDDSAEKTGK